MNQRSSEAPLSAEATSGTKTMTPASSVLESYSKRCRFLVELTTEGIELTIEKIIAKIDGKDFDQERLDQVNALHREISALMIPKKAGGKVGEQIIQQKRKQKRRRGEDGGN